MIEDQPNEPPQATPAPVQLDGYAIGESIGSGAFSHVYLATQKSTGQKVAIKVLKLIDEDQSDKNEKRTVRFRREMELSRELHHPNIVRVLDYSEQPGGKFCTVFEYVPGKTLRDILKDEGALSLERTQTIMLQVLDAIASAHDKGIVHRDLKPENIMVTTLGAQDSVKILDFGVSTLSVEQQAQHTRLTLTHEYLGTPAYSSPEQFRGQEVTEKSDLFTWSLIFLECLTGSMPYKEEHSALIVQRQLSPDPVPLPPTLMNSRLGWLLAWGLQKDPARRASNARQLYTRLSKIELTHIPREGDFLDTETHDISRETLISGKETEQHSQRQVTVIACDVYFEAINKQSQSQPEVQDLVLGDLLSSVAYRMTELGGFVVEPLVDRIVILYGYPELSDSDTRRAAAAALELRTYLLQRNHFFKTSYGISVNFQIGLHTGMVTCLDQTGELAVPKGITLSTAGRLCSNAPAGKILISEGCQSLIESAFDLIPQDGQSDFSGGHAAILTGSKRVQGLHDIEQDKAAPFIGREREWAQLSKLLTKSAKSGQRALLMGEAGIGKSRLIEELAAVAMANDRPVYEMAAFPEYSNNALFPFISLLKNKLNLERFSTEEERDNHLIELLEKSSLQTELFIPLLYRWLGITSTQYPPLLNISPPKQKVLFLNSIVDFILECLLEPSAIIIFEDIHWIDPSSLEVLNHLLAKLESFPVFLMMTARPTFTPSWDGVTVKNIQLKSLDEESVQALFQENLGDIQLTSSQYDRVLERVDGNPLFAVELACSIKAKLGESLPEETVIDSIGKNLDIEVPTTLKNLLASRLEQMGSAKQTAQLAAVIGRRFEFELLAKISNKDGGTLLADLEQLVAAKVLHPVHRSEELEYVFHHVLVRDHAYESLSRNETKDAHQEIAQTIEATSPESCKAEPELLARHWAGAENFAKAADYGLLSTSNALMNSFFEEAIINGNEALKWVAQDLSKEGTVEKELQISQLTVNAYVAARGAAFPKVEKIYERTDTLVESLPPGSPIAYSLLLGKILHYHSIPDYKKSKMLWDQALPIAQVLNRDPDLAVLYAFETHRLASHGQFQEMLSCYEQTVHYYEKCEGIDFPTQYSFNPKVISHGVRANYFMLSGDIAQARDSIQSCIQYSRSMNDAHSIGIALGQELFLECATGEKGLILEKLPVAKAHMDEYGMALWGQMLMILEGWAISDLTTANTGLALLHAIGYKPFALFWNSLLAEIEFENGDVDAALARLDPLLKEGPLDEVTCIPPVYRVKGLCHAKRGELDAVEEAFSKGLELTESIGVSLLSVRLLIDWYHSTAQESTKSNCLEQLGKHATLFDNAPHIEMASEMKALLSSQGG